jgi:hypothetical protein
MPDQRPTVFQTNPNKDFLRTEYDYSHVERWCRKSGMRLRYLGLPAWEMLDIISWEKFLERFTTIEREENQQHLMFLQANVRDVENRLYSLYGEFDQILLSGRDKYGRGPEWPYDIVNLDYFGGFLYSDLSRPRSIKKLISNQANFQRGFLLIITQHLRDADTLGEKGAFLEDLRRSLKSTTTAGSAHKTIDKVIDWYASPSTPDSFRQTLYMNVFLRDAGEADHFNVECRAGILYSGTGKASMVHFVTDFVFCPGIGHKTASAQSLPRLIDLGTLEVRDGAFASPALVAPKLAIPSQISSQR